jgi:hypothetical protein
MVFAANGQPFILGQVNVASALTRLTGNVDGAAMQVVNNNADANDTALTLNVQSGEAPMRVSSDKLVNNLNADELDGQEAGDLAEPLGYAHVKIGGGVDSDYPSKGVNGVVIADPVNKPSVYCFDLAFTPKTAVGSPHLNNNAVVATSTPNLENPFSDAVRQNCEAPFTDAAAHTYAADTGANAPINFQIVFE